MVATYPDSLQFFYKDCGPPLYLPSLPNYPLKHRPCYGILEVAQIENICLGLFRNIKVGILPKQILEFFFMLMNSSQDLST